MSNFGRVIWSEQPFSFEVTETGIQVEGTGEVFSETHGTTLKEACMWAQNTLYQKKTGIPPREFFTKPQFNTWIELIYDQNQEDILKYARSVAASGYPHGVLMIDDN